MKLYSLQLATVAAVLISLAAVSPASAEEAPQKPGGSILPVPGAPDPAPFTLVDRYLDAARRGDLVMLERCIGKGVNAAVKDEVGRSALLLAVRDGKNLEIVKLLVDKGLSVAEADARGRTPLADAAALGLTDIVAYLIERGVDVNLKDKQGQAALYNAVLGGNRETVERLLAAGADIDTRDRYGDTPLMGACNRANEELARLLVEKGADVTLSDQENRTAAERAPEHASYCRSLSAKTP